MKPEELVQALMKMYKETQEGKLKWKLVVQTTEGNEEKYTVQEDGQEWTVDECYVSYDCEYRGEEFCMISYEMIKNSGAQVRTMNYIFLPPLGVRLFSLHTLLEHSVKADAVLVSQVHALWVLLMQIAKKGSGQVELSVTQADVNVEEDI
ncbi:MAG: hypothetical protein HFI06_01660 [Eubacterium sp.]|jgi:hypothetical protein|nr:hypothetical protein [Eubacterium sp.]